MSDLSVESHTKLLYVLYICLQCPMVNTHTIVASCLFFVVRLHKETQLLYRPVYLRTRSLTVLIVFIIALTPPTMYACPFCFWFFGCQQPIMYGGGAGVMQQQGTGEGGSMNPLLGAAGGGERHIYSTYYCCFVFRLLRHDVLQFLDVLCVSCV